MLNFFKKKNVVLIASLLIMLILVVSIASDKYDLPLTKSVIMTISRPFNIATHALGNTFSKSSNFITSFIYTYDENKKLREEISVLRKANIDAGEIWAENKRLKDLLGYKESQSKFIFLTAKVIGYNPTGTRGSVFIDKGQNNGLSKSMSVVTSDGLVGNIIDVYEKASKVQLILHPKSAVGGIIQREESRLAGIVSGNSTTPFNPNFVNLARDADIVEGDTILTSGFGGMYPKGLVIGTVTSVENAEGGLLKYAVLTPSVDFKRLEEVMVITNVTNYSALDAETMGE